jgi:diguanylate cyclase (GGDEF)-like protein
MGKRHARSSGDAGASGGPEVPAPAVAASGPHRWLAAAALIVVGGIVGSVLAATSVAHRDAQTARAAFSRSSGEIASTLQLAIQNQESLVVNASAFLLDNPDASNADLAQWLGLVQAFDRHPELERAGLLVTVTAADLLAFAARSATDPPGPLEPDGSFQVIPPGDRPLYCFMVVQQISATQPAIPAGVDYCSDPALYDTVVTARDSGLGSYLPTSAEFGNSLIVQVPMYQGGVVPATVADRRAGFVGLFGVQLNSGLLLDRALQGHMGIAVTLRYHDVHSDAQFSAGEAPRGSASTVIDLPNGWSVETFAAASPDGLFRNATAVLVLAGGTALSLALAAFGFVLVTGRARALGLADELRHQALHDALTGLPNRALIMDRIEQLLFRNRRQATTGAALFVDLDDFKNVNDTLGHEAGDRLLVAVAARLTGSLRDADTIGRMGGDEFVVLIDGASLEVDPELVAERLLEVMRQPFFIDGSTMPVTVSTSIGIAMGDRANPGDLLRDADLALYRAKAAGKNCYQIFHAEMQTEIMHRVELEFDLRSALADGQFRLVYQPIYNLEELTLVGVEALLRWDHPSLGTIPPDQFIPILELSGQMQDVGRWVLQQACDQMATWHASGDTLDVSVNVSGRQLDHDSIVDHVRLALDHSGLEPGALIIEVTETALMRDPDETARRLRAIRELGVRIAVDDFGTGYSSLAYLQQFPVDCLKIDRMFTNAITTSPEAKALIGILVQLGRDLGLKTLAEGVETTAELDHLRGEHVDEAQGFLMSRPLDPQTLEAQLLVPTRPTLHNPGLGGLPRR